MCDRVDADVMVVWSSFVKVVNHLLSHRFVAVRFGHLASLDPLRVLADRLLPLYSS